MEINNGRIEDMLLLCDPYKLIEGYIIFHSKILGIQKSEEILNKVTQSKKIRRIILKLTLSKSYPTKDYFIYSVNAVPYFYTSKAETVCLATLLAIKMWTIEGDIEQNFPEHINIVRAAVVKTILKSAEMKSSLSKNYQFFERFFDFLSENIKIEIHSYQNKRPKVILKQINLENETIEF